MFFLPLHVNEVDRRAAWGCPPDHRNAKSADEERFDLVLGNVGRSALDSLESRFDIQQCKFARNRSARFRAKGARVVVTARAQQKEQGATLRVCGNG
jgi:hypothetical protein